MARRSKTDPTGQARNRIKSASRVSVRLSTAEKQIKANFNDIPRASILKRPIANVDQTVVFDYEHDQQLSNESIKSILDGQLLETSSATIPTDWFWRNEVELPYRQGTVEEIRDFNQIIAGAIIAGVLVDGLPPTKVDPSSVLLSDRYRVSLETVQVDNFDRIKTLSDTTASGVIQRINVGIQAGQTPKSIVDDITERFDVAKSQAARIASTEINKAYNDASLSATQLLGDQSGLNPVVIHISALLPTTRAEHAARHGNAYTVEDQLQWWNTGSNRINCKCSTRSVLINDSGDVIDVEFQDEIKSERSFFD